MNSLSPISDDHVSFDEAQRVLFRASGTNELLPDRILETASRLSIPYVFRRLDDWEEHEAGGETYEELDIFNGRQLPEEEVLVITDGSFTSGRVLRCCGGRLRECLFQQNSVIFDGDVIFLWPESGRISIFHHEGGFAHVGW